MALGLSAGISVSGPLGALALPYSNRKAERSSGPLHVATCPATGEQSKSICPAYNGTPVNNVIPKPTLFLNIVERSVRFKPELAHLRHSLGPLKTEGTLF